MLHTIVEVIHILSCIRINITLLPLSPTDVSKHFNELAENCKRQPVKSVSSDVKHDEIKWKGSALLLLHLLLLSFVISMMHLVILCFLKMFACLQWYYVLYAPDYHYTFAGGWLQFNKGRIMRISPCWPRTHHVLPQAISRLQLSYHIWFGFSQPSTVSTISPSYDTETRCINMCWKGDDDVIVLVIVLPLEGSWIMLCDYDKVLHHLFGSTCPCINSGL
jgi:hypothetical protein